MFFSKTISSYDWLRNSYFLVHLNLDFKPRKKCCLLLWIEYCGTTEDFTFCEISLTVPGTRFVFMDKLKHNLCSVCFITLPVNLSLYCLLSLNALTSIKFWKNVFQKIVYWFAIFCCKNNARLCLIMYLILFILFFDTFTRLNR